MSDPPLHEQHLPFTRSQLRAHFAPVARERDGEFERHLRYYVASIERYASWDPLKSTTWQESRRVRQIEKDERFKVATALLRLYYSSDPGTAFAELMRTTGVPAPLGSPSWDDALRGELKLYFEVGLNSPRSYREWLKSNLSERCPVPYLQEAGVTARQIKGATQVGGVHLAPVGAAIRL